MRKPLISTNGLSKISTRASGNSKSPETDPIAEKIRELQRYDEDEDRISSVNIHVEEGAILNLNAPDSDPPIIKKTKWTKWAAPLFGGLVTIGAVVKAWWDATH